MFLIRGAEMASHIPATYILKVRVPKSLEKLFYVELADMDTFPTNINISQKVTSHSVKWPLTL